MRFKRPMRFEYEEVPYFYQIRELALVGWRLIAINKHGNYIIERAVGRVSRDTPITAPKPTIEQILAESRAERQDISTSN